MTKTHHRYTAEQFLESAKFLSIQYPSISSQLDQAATDATTLQSLRDENARLLKVVELVANFSDRTHMDKLQVIWHLQDIARNALKGD